MELPETAWVGNVEFKKKLTKEDSKFILEQAEKLLKDSIDTGATIVTRTNTLVTILSALIIAVSGYIISSWAKYNEALNMFICSIIGLAYLFCVAVNTVRNIAPTPYYPIGSLPENLIIASFFAEVIPNEDRIIRYYVSESEQYQFRIDENNKLNKFRWKLYKRSLWALMLTPAVFILIYFFVISFRAIFST